jgi:hypothetical protein
MKPPISGVDLAISIVVLVLTLIGGAGAAFLALMMMAFTDHCPPETCHIDAGVTAVFAAFGVAAVVGIAGTVATVLALVRRVRAWPFAVGTMVLCAACCLLGLLGYGAAVS